MSTYTLHVTAVSAQHIVVGSEQRSKGRSDEGTLLIRFCAITPRKIVGVTPHYDFAELVDGIGSMDDETERSGRSSRVVGNTLGW